MASHAFGRLKKSIFQNKSLMTLAKRVVYKAVVFGTLLYGSGHGQPNAYQPRNWRPSTIAALEVLLLSHVFRSIQKEYPHLNLVIYMELHSSKGKGDRGKRTSDRARTRDLRSIAEFQPREPQRPVEILRPPSLLCTGHRCAAIQRHLRPAP